MVKYLLAALAGVAIAGAGYLVVTHHCPGGLFGVKHEEEADCCSTDGTTPVSMVMADTGPASTKAAGIDMKNTKCIVMGEDISTRTVEYQGKVYHICCAECIETFKKDPEKYVKAFEADPAKFGVK